MQNALKMDYDAATGGSSIKMPVRKPGGNPLANARHYADGGLIGDPQQVNPAAPSPNAQLGGLVAQAIAGLAPKAPAPMTQAQIVNQDMNNLGKVSAIPGEGSGASHNWMVKSAAEQAQAQGLDPNAGKPFYKPSGQLTKGSVRDGYQPAARNAPPANMMTPVDQLFAPRGFAGGGIVGLMAGRGAQIDAAVDGAVNGAQPATPAPVQPAAPEPVDQSVKDAVARANAATKPKGMLSGLRSKLGFAQGGKIEGPGTPTSDSIDAEVRETGEPIKVSTDERILSEAQDAFLSKLAEQLGFASLDEMLEQGTGQPVGPTVKGGQRAAAGGLPPETADTWPNGQKKLAPANPLAQVAAAPAVAADPSMINGIRHEAQPVSVGNPLAAIGETLKFMLPVSADSRIEARRTASRTELNEAPTAPAASKPGNPPVAAPASNPVTTQETGNGFTGQKMVSSGNGDYAVSGKATQDATKMQAPDGGGYVTGKGGKAIFAPGGAPQQASAGPKDAYGNDMTRTNAMKAELAQMERARYGRDMQDDIKDPRVIALAQLNLNRLNQQEQGERQAVSAGLDQQGKRDALAKSGQINQMISELSSAKTPEDLSAKRSNLLAAQGRNPNEHRYFVGDDEMTGVDGSKSKRSVLLDALAPGGRPGGQAQGSSANVPSQAADMLRKNPALAADFDKKYGAGAAKQILGR
ncbi:MAG: hypothetical protein WC023_01405 [Rhodocyclaceae bacterium]